MFGVNDKSDVVDVVDVVDNVIEILILIKENPEITTKELGKKLDMSERQIQRVIKKLRDSDQYHFASG